MHACRNPVHMPNIGAREQGGSCFCGQHREGMHFAAFSVVCMLAGVSTLIDVIIQRPTPTPFGTQHIALLCTAWGPAVVFGERTIDLLLLIWDKS